MVKGCEDRAEQAAETPQRPIVNSPIVRGQHHGIAVARDLMAVTYRADRLARRVNNLAEATLVAGRAAPLPQENAGYGVRELALAFADRGPGPGLSPEIFAGDGRPARLAVIQVVADMQALEQDCMVLARHGQLLTLSMERQIAAAEAYAGGKYEARHDYEIEACNIRYLAAVARRLVGEIKIRVGDCERQLALAARRLAGMIAVH